MLRAGELRELGLSMMRGRIAAIFGIDPDGDLALTLAQFSRAAIDGALLAVKIDGAELTTVLAPLPRALVATYECETQR